MESSSSRRRRRSRSRSPRSVVHDHRRHRRQSRSPTRTKSPHYRDDLRKKDRSRSRSKTTRSRQKSQSRKEETEDLELRIVVCQKLSSKVQKSDLYKLFESVGTVVKNIKMSFQFALAFVELDSVTSVGRAMKLEGRLLHGCPMSLKMPQRGKVEEMLARHRGRIFVGNLHPSVTEEVLRNIFELYGEIHCIEMKKEKSSHFGFIDFCRNEDADSAKIALNSSILFGRPLYINNKLKNAPTNSEPDAATAEDIDRVKISKLSAEREKCLCLVASNMFDPFQNQSLLNPAWESELRNDILSEIIGYNGRVVHFHVDKASAEGNVYMKCPNSTSASGVKSALNERYFDGRLVRVRSIPSHAYYGMFPAAESASTPLVPSPPPAAAAAVPPGCFYPTYAPPLPLFSSQYHSTFHSSQYNTFHYPP